ncbi:MAG: sigma-70 family RNA polymerase sigma factor [Planctomycetes bacterium]|nr:sigma-70 family RNA polymerase sigma factor [Planctomycetota bacterium]
MSVAQATDEELAARYQEGEVAAFEELLRRHQRSVYNFIYRFLGNSPRADDLFQEVFLKVVRGIGSFRHDSKFTTWLFRITRNVCIDDLRRKRVQDAIPTEGGPGGGARFGSAAESVPDPAEPVDEVLARRELVEVLEGGVSLLAPEQREVFLLREHAGLAFQDIARVVGCTRNTAKSRMRYALEKLRRYLEDRGSAAGRRRAAGG